jgi:site-specific DNA-methyltransferase (cytosine-N4-specific)
MMDEVYRVLKAEGTAWVNLGDSYSTQSGTNAALAAGRKYDSESTYMTNRGESELLIKDKSLPNKCLLLIPHRFAIGCIDRGWTVRNDIVWAKRNGMPESVTDRFAKKHEYFFLMVKNEKYYFDLDGVRGKQSKVTIERYNYGWNGNEDRSYTKGPQNNMNRYLGDPEKKKQAIERGKNPGDVADFWDIPTLSSGEKHYAAYNERLISKPIVAGCPEGGIILDPFCGTATTGCRAINLKRKFIGFEGKEEYVKIGNRKIEKHIRQQHLF